MTKVKLLIGNNRLNGFEIKGHSGYGTEGDDIVCAAVSSAALMTVNTITEIIGDTASIEQDDGYLRLSVDKPSCETVKILEGFKLHMTGISEQYPQNIRIIYGGVQNAQD